MGNASEAVKARSVSEAIGVIKGRLSAKSETVLAEVVRLKLIEMAWRLGVVMLLFFVALLSTPLHGGLLMFMGELPANACADALFWVCRTYESLSGVELAGVLFALAMTTMGLIVFVLIFARRLFSFHGAFVERLQGLEHDKTRGERIESLDDTLKWFARKRQDDLAIDGVLFIALALAALPFTGVHFAVIATLYVMALGMYAISMHCQSRWESKIDALRSEVRQRTEHL